MNQVCGRPVEELYGQSMLLLVNAPETADQDLGAECT